jgi:hypothetical protein
VNPLKTASLRHSDSPEILRPVYQFWKENWNREFRDQGLHGITSDNSDDFWSADSIRVVYLNGMVVSLMIESQFDLGLEWDRAHSYFNGYPPELFDGGPRKVTALRYFVVAPEFRKDSELQVGSTTLALCFDAFMRSDSKHLIGMTLRRLGAHNLCMKFGMQIIGSGRESKHGVGVAYVIVDKERLNHLMISRLIKGISNQFESRPTLERGSKDLLGAMAYKKTGKAG